MSVIFGKILCKKDLIVNTYVIFAYIDIQNINGVERIFAKSVIVTSFGELECIILFYFTHIIINIYYSSTSDDITISINKIIKALEAWASDGGKAYSECLKMSKYLQLLSSKFLFFQFSPL